MTTLIPKFQQTGTGAVNQAISVKLGETVSVLDFGADPTGNTDSYAAIMAAIASLGESGTVYFPKGVYACSDTIVIQDTNPYPATPVGPDDNHFINLVGDGMEATWLVHTGTQTTGCVNIIGNANWFPTSAAYVIINNGTSSVSNMALGSNYGPALRCTFANKMRHNKVFLYSAATTAASLDIQACIESYFNAMQCGGGNNETPYGQYTKVKSLLPTGNATQAQNNIYIDQKTQNDGTHGAGNLSSLELFFFECRTDASSTLNSVDIRNSRQINFDNCKLTGPQTQNEYVVNVNGGSYISFSQCILEPLNFSGATAGAIRLASNEGASGVTMNQCTSWGGGYVDIGILAGGDSNDISFQMTDSNFYQCRLSPTARDNGHIKLLSLVNNVFRQNLDAQFQSAYIEPTPLIPNYNIVGNVFDLPSGILQPCSNQASNGLKNIIFDVTGKLSLMSTAAGAGTNITFDDPDAAAVSSQIGMLNSVTKFQVQVGGTGGVEMASGATSWSAISDERLKDIIEPITDAVNKLNTLRTVIGKYKSDDDRVRRSFLIAQDVEAVFPEAVIQGATTIADVDYLSLAYTDLIPLLVAGVKELSDKVKALELK